MGRLFLGRRSFLKWASVGLAGLGVSLKLNLRRVLGQPGAGYCSELHERIREEFDSFDPGRVFQVPVCLYPISKDLSGEVTHEWVDQPRCEDTRLGGECITSQTIETLRFQVQTNQSCDSEVSLNFLDGDFQATLAVTYIEDGNQRGYHTGTFEWHGSGSTVIGRMSGITNAGTHRPPLLECESCDAFGHMEGRLDGVATDGDLEGCCVFATYVAHFDPTSEGAEGGIQATLEGVVMCECA